MKHYMNIGLWCCAFLLSYSSGYSANDQALYEAPPNPKAVFIRFVNATAKHTQLRGSIVKARTIQPFEATDYIISDNTIIHFTLGNIAHTLQSNAGSFYTIALTNEGIVTSQDDIMEHPTKATVRGYNLSTTPSLSIVAPKHNTAIFENISTGNTASRSINPLTLALAVKDKNMEVASIPPIFLKRQNAYSVFLFSDVDRIKAVVVENTMRP